MRKRQILELALIVILGLTPLLWFQGNQVILGHDAGLTLSPISHFFDRLFAWTERFGFGNDQTYAIPGFFIHGLEALIASLGFNLQSVQKIVFIFWFLLPGLTMYYFSSKLAKKFDLPYFALPATVLYMFNHFLLQGWFVAERTKFSVYAALPLIIAFLFDWEEKRRSNFKTALFISLTLFFLNGEASLPLFGGLILSVIVFVIFYFIKQFSKQRVFQVIKLFGITFFISAFLNAYWLLPYGGYILQSYSSAVAQAGGLSGVLGWLSYVSQGSSLINIFRLQGIPEWYLNPLHPYASVFLGNIFVIALSFLIPIASFLPLYLAKTKEARQKIIFFSFLALFSIVFIAGAHPPFGEIYIFLVSFVPGFVAFRNPFYKFAPALWFSYAVLISFSINYFLQRVEVNRKLLAHLLYLVLSFVIVLYSFPFLNGVFFDYIKGERSMRVVVPEYVLDFGKWSESKENFNTKVLALPASNPDNKVDAYTWGYWSLSPLTSLLTNAPIINESNYMSQDEKKLIEKLYGMIKNNEPGWENFAKFLGIKSFLLRKDFMWNLKGSQTDNPSIYERTLINSNASLTKKFGEWEVYSFRDDVNKNVITASNVNYLNGEVADLGKIPSLPFFNPREPYALSNNQNSVNLLKIKNDLFLVSKCVSCNLQHIFINTDLFRPLITRGSIFYPIVEFKNKLAEKKIRSIPERVNFYLYSSLINIFAFDKLISENKDFGLLMLGVEDYGKSLNKLDSSLKNYLAYSKYIDNDFLIEVSEVLGIEKNVILFRNSSNLPSGELLNSLNQKYNDLKRIKNEIDKNIWQTSDEINKKFIVRSDTSAQFDFIYRPNFANFSPTEVNFTIDEENHNVKPSFLSSGWFSLGKLSLSKGVHRLSIKQSVEDLYEGSSLIKFDSSPSVPCFSSNLIKGRKNDTYRISFQHRRIIGSKKFFVRILSSEIKPNPLDTKNYLLESTSVFDNYTADYALKDDQKFYLTVCNFPSADKEEFSSSIELKDISIRKIDVPDVVFYSPSSSKNSIESKFRKESQTEYVVSDLSNMNKVIVLNESYNKNWILPEIKNSTHFVANGYVNGWLVEDKNNSFSIKYKPQDFVYFGFVLSFIALIASIILIFLNKKL